MAKALGTSKHSDQLSPAEKIYLDTIIETGDVLAARRASHIGIVSPRLAAAMHIAIRRRMAEGATLALKVIFTLLNTSESDKIRLECARTILDRSGHGAPRAAAEKHLTELPLHEMELTDLRAMATHLEAEIAGRAKAVPGDYSAIAAPVADHLSEFIE